jgi:3-hydroxyisobutyrate dehydrogenase-like beta-hydroxyacid dehydrogenase
MGAQMKVGLIGLGKMGLAIARRLRGQGLDHLVVWDHDAEKLKQCEGMNFKLAQNASEVSKTCDIVLSIINDDAGVKELYSSNEGLLANDVEGKLFIEMSTIQPQTARNLSLTVQSQGAHLIGAPLMGTIVSVNNGTVFIPVGASEDDLEKGRPILSLLSNHIKLMGPIGTGHAAKLVSNLTMAAYIQSIAEGLALSDSEGIDFEDMLEVLSLSPTSNPWLKNRSQFLRGLASDMTLDIRNMRKDVLNALNAGVSNGIPMDLTSSLALNLSSAIASGKGHEDIAYFPKFFREQMVQSPLK